MYMRSRQGELTHRRRTRRRRSAGAAGSGCSAPQGKRWRGQPRRSAGPAAGWRVTRRRGGWVPWRWTETEVKWDNEWVPVNSSGSALQPRVNVSSRLVSSQSLRVVYLIGTLGVWSLRDWRHCWPHARETCQANRATSKVLVGFGSS
jgi:hypothetical protein